MSHHIARKKNLNLQRRIKYSLQYHIDICIIRRPRADSQLKIRRKRSKSPARLTITEPDRGSHCKPAGKGTFRCGSPKRVKDSDRDIKRTSGPPRVLLMPSAISSI
jgi:hypothetical protein